ncbi:MAG TPA: ABC transporter ATP-binding protein [Candidatus Acidoferrum sp.]|jgi:ATP-binding cassette subfamily B protein|nr:ABC transporter ATP-binding protein [Candidatus Acidoferrum sp.]
MSAAATTSTALGTKTAADQPPKASAWKNLRGLLPYLRRYPGGLALGLLATVLMGIIGNVVPLATGIIIDVLAGSPRPFSNGVVVGALKANWLSTMIPFYQPSSRHTLGIYCLLLIGLIAIKGVLSFAARWILIGVSRDIEFDVRNDLLDRLLVLEPEFYVRNRTGELMSRATNDLNQVRMVLGPGIMYSATTLVTMLVAVVLMFKLSPSLTMWVLLPVPVVAVVVRHFGKVIHELYEKIQASLAAVSVKVQENLSGVRVIRAYAQEDAQIRAFDEPNREYVARNVELIRTWSMFMPSLTALIGTTFLIVLWKGGFLFLRNELSLGALVAFSNFLTILVWPMIALGWVTNIFQRGAASMGRLTYILNAQPSIDDRGAKVPTDKKLRGEIEFRDLSFTYPTMLSGDGNASPAGSSGGSANKAPFTRAVAGNGTGASADSNHPILQNINLTVPAGSTLAIVGPTGSGKTTLAALVARLWEAPNGTLLVDGRPIREWPLETLRRAIGYVPQDTYLFGDTLGENIAFGLPQYDAERVREAAEVASLEGDIDDFSQKYETVVGERGITLSGGQKQRTAIARALVRDPRILILDDSLSAVDTQTEERILSRLRGIMAGRTTILISHRTSTVQDADQIVVLRDGQIIERGKHDDLLARGGYYADLYHKQLLEEELERA